MNPRDLAYARGAQLATEAFLKHADDVAPPDEGAYSGPGLLELIKRRSAQGAIGGGTLGALGGAATAGSLASMSPSVSIGPPGRPEPLPSHSLAAGIGGGSVGGAAGALGGGTLGALGGLGEYGLRRLLHAAR